MKSNIVILKENEQDRNKNKIYLNNKSKIHKNCILSFEIN